MLSPMIFSSDDQLDNLFRRAARRIQNSKPCMKNWLKLKLLIENTEPDNYMLKKKK